MFQFTLGQRRFKLFISFLLNKVLQFILLGSDDNDEEYLKLFPESSPDKNNLRNKTSTLER